MALYNKLYVRFPDLHPFDIVKSMEVIINGMAEALKRHRRIEVRGFGSFEIVRRPPRNGRNPMTGEPVKVPSKSVPHFKPGKDLKDRVNASKRVVKISKLTRGRPAKFF